MNQLTLSEFTAVMLGERSYTLSNKEIKHYRNIYFPYDHAGRGANRNLNDWVIDNQHQIECKDERMFKVYDLLLNKKGNLLQCCQLAHIGKTTFNRYHCNYSLYHYHDQKTDQVVSVPGLPDLFKKAKQLNIDLPNRTYLYAAANTDGICVVKGHIYGQISRTFYLKKLVRK